jgi:hypothetical protein
MTVGEARGLATFLRSIRGDEEWQTSKILNALAKLQDEGYTTQDITEACTAIALDRSNLYATMLSIKAPEMIAKKHAAKVNLRTGGPSRRGDDSFLCDVCGKSEGRCQSDATNLNGSDHAFVNVSRRDLDRDQMHADGRIAAARANAISKAASGLFALPADVTNPTHPEPQQEEEAS